MEPYCFSIGAREIKLIKNEETKEIETIERERERMVFRRTVVKSTDQMSTYNSTIVKTVGTE